MSGTVWDQLRDFKLAVGDHHILHDPRMVNLAGYNKYLFHTIFGNNGEKSIQGGDEMNFSVFFDVGNTYQHPLPAAFRQWKRVDNGYEIKQRWAKSTDHKTWIRDEIVKAKSRGGSWFDVLFAMDRKLEQRLMVSRDNGLENDLWAEPNYNAMENRAVGSQGILPMSLFYHVNEDAFGCYGRYVVSNAAPSQVSRNSAVTNGAGGSVLSKQQWTMFTDADTLAVSNATLIGANYDSNGFAATGGGYATSSKYSPTQMRYSSNRVNHPDNIFGTLRSGLRRCQWEGPSDTKQWYENSTMNNFRLYTSDYGCRLMETMVKEGQDRWVLGPQDISIPEVQANGIPIRWNPKLDTLAIYDGTSATAPSTKTTELAASHAGARIYGFNFNTIYPVVHEGMWNYRESMPPHFNVPDVFVEYIEDWWQTACEDYRQQLVVSPRGDMRGLQNLTTPTS